MSVAAFDPEHAISPGEFRERQDRARAAAAEQGLDGIVVWSRGGGPVDMSADGPRMSPSVKLKSTALSSENMSL